MYQSKILISTYNKLHCLNILSDFLQKNRSIYCRALKKKVSLKKLPEVFLQRKNAKHRLQRFFVAIDILKHEKIVSSQNFSVTPSHEMRETA